MQSDRIKKGDRIRVMMGVNAMQEGIALYVVQSLVKVQLDNGEKDFYRMGIVVKSPFKD